MKYYISDLHLFHDAAIRFDNRPFDNVLTMHEYIRTHWNNKITNGDTVYILGDMSLRGQKENLIAYVSTLKGKKVLVKGNHDDVSDYRYQQLFAEICDYKEVHDTHLVAINVGCMKPWMGYEPRSLREILEGINN